MARPERGRGKAWLRRPATATNSAGTALSRSGPRKRAVRCRLPSLLRTMPSPTSATQGRKSASRVLRLRYSARFIIGVAPQRSEEHTSELQSLMRISYAVFCLKKKKKQKNKSMKLHQKIHNTEI